jgi:hypothetical protein
MSKFLCILKAIVQYRSLLFPAIVGFIGAVATAMGRKIDIGKVQALVDATSLLATAGAAVIGAALDVRNSETKTAIADTKAQAQGNTEKIAETVKVANANTAVIDPRNATPSSTPLQYVTLPIPPENK